MKQLKKITGIMSLFVVTLTSCQKTPIQPTTAAIVQQGKWIVNRLSSSGTDVTSRFSGFKITFNANGIATAMKDTSTVTGTWAIENEDDDSQKKINLNFGEEDPFDKLSDDWNISDEATNSIRLEHTSHGHDGSDFMTIEKE